MIFDWLQAAAPVAELPREIHWLRTSRARRCPVCGKPDWCTVSEGGDVACCMRVESARPAHNGGWIHQTAPGSALQPVTQVYTPRPEPEPSIDAPTLWASFAAATTDAMRHQLAASLGVKVRAVEALEAAWAAPHGAWAFPMKDGRARTIGIRLRAMDGSKWAVRGSRSGLFIPRSLASSNASPLLICEGPTDTAAALSLGFDAIGRPSCSGSVDQVLSLLGRGPRRDVAIVADNDGPGVAGAERLAREIVAECRTLKVIRPAPHKDLREWLRFGATPAVVSLRIEAARYVRKES